MPRDLDKKREYNRKWRAKNPDYLKEYYTENKEKFRKHNKTNKRRNAEYIQEAKRDGKCVRCGWNDHPCALDFHHIDPANKITEIANMIRGGSSIQKIQEEMNKCVLVCANCHRILHHNEKTKKQDT